MPPARLSSSQAAAPGCVRPKVGPSLDPTLLAGAENNRE
jgi:hypothetical protein